MSEDENFLERWSRRKRDGSAEDVKPDAEPIQSADTAEIDAEAELADDTTLVDGISEDQTADGETQDEPAPWEGIDIDSLDADSDISAFMADGVPLDVRQRALEQIWRSDPIFANLDGLNDYDDDYSKWGIVNQVVKSAWRAGKGYMSDEEYEEVVAQNARDELKGQETAEPDSEETADGAETDAEETVAEDEGEIVEAGLSNEETAGNSDDTFGSNDPETDQKTPDKGTS